MTLRGVFIADGSSDLPLAGHLGHVARRSGLEVSIVTPDPARLGAASRAVTDRLSALLRHFDEFDVFFVHRDSEGERPEDRREEVLDGAAEACVDADRVVPVVPVRMTEAWLLLDEASVRFVAGKPSGRVALDLPNWRRVESVADPKALLQNVLVRASETTGRRRANFVRDFSRHRQGLLARLDPDGDVRRLPSWQMLIEDVARVTSMVAAGRPDH